VLKKKEPIRWALKWLSTGQTDPSFDEFLAGGFSNMPGLGMGAGKYGKGITLEKKLDSAMDCLRQNEVSYDDIDPDTLNTFRNIAGLPSVEAKVPEEERVKALAWLRTSNPTVDDFDEEALAALINLAMPGSEEALWGSQGYGGLTCMASQQPAGCRRS
jgi:hypothetical protein